MSTIANASPSKVADAAKLATTPKGNTTATPMAATQLKPAPAPKPATAPKVTEANLKAEAEKTPNKPDASAAAPTPATECARIIDESETLVEALEACAAMYNIPEENIVCDDTLTDIKVQGDTIIAPSISPKGKGAAILRSIAAVLDYISQRIDQKVSDFQISSIEKGKITDHIRNDANPAKGTVINRLVDPDGGEIIVYDSGLVDMPNTFTAVNFVNKLRADGTIPHVTAPAQPSNTGISYFTDEDNIDPDANSSQGGSDYQDAVQAPNNETPGTTADYNAASQDEGQAVQAANESDGVANYETTNNTGGTDEDGLEEMVNIPQRLSESEVFIDMIAKRGDTRHLGYDIMMEQGFSFVKPVDFIMESSNSKTKDIKPEDIKYSKFDNSHIMKAIKLMNEVRKEQAEVVGKHFNLEKMVNNPKWSQAVKELEQQFDCHLTVRFFETKEMSSSGSGFTQVSNMEVKHKCTISKSKGFQLNGMPITIFFINSFLTENGPSDPNLFGQFVISVMLHEIFHNIYGSILKYSTEFSSMLTTTMITASLTKSAKVRRKLLSNFVNAANNMGLISLNPVQKKLYIKKLLLTCSLDMNLKNMKDAKSLVEDGDSEQLDRFIKTIEQRIKKDKAEVYGHGTEVGAMCLLALNVLIGMIGLAYGVGYLVVLGVSGSLTTIMNAGSAMAVKSKMKKEINDRKTGSTKDFEEHWCDMFATMYSLPEGFLSNPAKMVAAKMTDDQIKRLHAIEQDFVNIYGDPHPPTSERLAASVKASKKLLDSGAKIDPAVKSYLEWIIANHSRILDVEDIDTNYSKSTFDPKTAEDLDSHIQNLISKGNIQLTEQAILYLLKNDGDYDY
jgi:hypothetical protein